MMCVLVFYPQYSQVQYMLHMLHFETDIFNLKLQQRLHQTWSNIIIKLEL